MKNAMVLIQAEKIVEKSLGGMPIKMPENNVSIKERCKYYQCNSKLNFVGKSEKRKSASNRNFHVVWSSSLVIARTTAPSIDQ